MASHTITKNTCPKCKAQGRSVAAMHYEETQVWNKDGIFSADGVVLGSAGLGIGIGGGSYSETGHSATKRAETFAEPLPYQLPVSSILIAGIVLIMSYGILPVVVDVIDRVVTDDSVVNSIHAFMMPIIKYFAPVAVIFILFKCIIQALINQDENNRIVSEDYPRILDRYNEIFYCQSCHVLFDNQGNSANANPRGFDHMLSMPADALTSP